MRNPYTWRGLLGALGVILLIWWGLSIVMGAVNGRLPTRSPDAETIGGHVLYLASYYGFLPAVAVALMYYARRRR